MTERVALEDSLRHLADHDALTGLLNRRRFQEVLQGQLDGEGPGGAVLFLDLDGFKEVNDTLGHPTGDALLLEVTGWLRECLHDGELLARLSGDEFGAILPGADEGHARAVAARMLDRLRHRTVSVRASVLGVTVSIGIALYPAHGKSRQELMTNADIALYRAKANGRNQACLYTAHIDGVDRNGGWVGGEGRLRDALQQNRFTLHAQPIQELKTGQVTAYELLLRVQEGRDRLIPPSAFLGIAERFGMIHDIDRWVAEQAIALLAALRGAGREPSLSVNLSAKAFLDRELPDLLERRLAQSGANPAALVLEITETARIVDLEAARSFISQLKSLGCRFALDDFGVGYSSFQIARELPIDILKIDGSFIRNLRTDARDQAVVRSILHLAEGLGMTTVAEFVEDEPTLELLRSFGVHCVQGYLIGKPAPAHRLLAGL